MSVQIQEAAFATGILHNIYAFHRYTMNSTSLYRTLVSQFWMQFPDFVIAQTIIADISVIVIRHDLGLTPCFYLLADIASTEYLWEVLLDAMLEFVGGGVGLAALHTLLEQEPVSAM